MAPSGSSSSSKGKAKARPASPPQTLDSIICSRPELLARLESARAETNRGLQSGSSRAPQGRKQARTSPAKSTRDEKRRREDEANFEPNEDDGDRGSAEPDGRSEDQDSHSAAKVAKRSGRPIKEEVDIGAVVILPHGTMDFQKRIKKPSYDDVTALIHQCLVIRASRHGELTVSKAWTNSEGLSWIATIFPDLTSLLFRRHPSEDNFGLVPLAANGQYLRVVSGFEGAAFVDRTASAKSAWDKKILRFVTKFKLQPIDIAVLDPPVFPEEVDLSNIAGPSGSHPMSSSIPGPSRAPEDTRRRSSRLIGSSMANSAITVHGSDSDEGPAAVPATPEEQPNPVPDNVPSSTTSFIFADPLAEFL